MKRLLKYLLLAITILAFDSGAKEAFPAQKEIDSFTLMSVDSADIGTPCQASTVASPRLQGNARRQVNSQRQNHELVKSRQSINSWIRYLAQKRSAISHSSLVEPALKLVRLCKFII